MGLLFLLFLVFLDVFTIHFVVLRSKAGETVDINDDTISETERDFNKWLDISGKLLYAFWVCIAVVMAFIGIDEYFDYNYYWLLIIVETLIVGMSFYLWRAKDYVISFASLLLLVHLIGFTLL